MKYIINPYSQVILNNGTYEFYAPPQKSATIKLELDVSNNMTIKTLLSPDGLSKEDLIDMVGSEKADFLINHEIFVDSLPNENTISSRTDQFFKQHLSIAQQEQIRNSNILILGCGGIGSSIAWIFASLGVKRITIVDFDIIEISNLNRMFMFDITDVGKKKVFVIKDKLNKLYPDIEITAIDRKVCSESELSEICVKEHFSIIIKALDSPSIFPIWLDSVCKKNSLKYVGGITLRDRILVGPTYIPNVAEDGWSDIIHMDNSSEHVFGKIPSLDVMLFSATDRIAVESIKILLGNYNACEYKNCIFSENIFTGEQEVIRSKKSSFKDNGNKKATALLNFFAIIGFGICTVYNSIWSPFVFVLACFLPFCSYYGEKYILLQTFINSTAYSLFLSFSILNNIGFGFFSFCLVSIVMASLLSMISLLINSIVIKAIKSIR